MPAPDRAELANQKLNDPADSSPSSNASTLDSEQTGPFTPQAAQIVEPFPASIPGFELLEPIGQGGMGVVYKAMQLKLNRVVALKTMLGQRASSQGLLRFLLEAEAVAAVKHRNIVQVYEFGDADGRPFLAMEYLPGGSLANRLKMNGRQSALAASTLIAALADAVHAAHDKGIVHRDLKSANVLFDEHNEPKVTDFGLAKRDGGSDLTATQAIMGTPAYMAPEQAKGETKFVGPAADIYSLGVILYECLTGTRPFAGPDAIALLRKVVEDEAERPSRRAPDVPRDLELICLKCLNKQPHDRYQTAKALADDLKRFAAGEPVTVRPMGFIERGVKWARRKPTLAAVYGLASVSFLLFGLVAGAFWLWQRAEAAKDQSEIAKKGAEVSRDAEIDARNHAETSQKSAESARNREQSARKNEETARRKADDLATKLEAFEYGGTMRVAHQEWRDGNITSALALLDKTPRHLRGWEWNYLNRLCHLDLVTLKGHTKAVHTASFSKDGLRIVTGSADNTAKVWEVASGRELVTFKGHSTQIYSASFSADGSRIVTTSQDDIAKVWDADTGVELLMLRQVTAASFSPDGTRIVTGSRSFVAKVWDARTGAELHALKGHNSQVHVASFSADGSRIVTGSLDGILKVWNAQTASEIQTIKGHDLRIISATFTSGGSRIVTTSADYSAKVWNAKTGAEVTPRTFSNQSAGIYLASFRADGSRIVTVAPGSNTAVVWDAQTHTELFTIRGHTGSITRETSGEITSVSFNVDGSRIVTGSSDGTAKLWSADPGAEVLTLSGHPNDGSQYVVAAFSTDGSRVVTASCDGTAKIWDSQTGVEVFTLRGHRLCVNSATFSLDGSKIVTGGSDKLAKVWDSKTGVEIVELKGHNGVILSASFNLDGSRIVTGSEDGAAKVWDAKTGTNILTLAGHRGPLNSASFSPNGARIVTGSTDKTTKVWDSESGFEILTITGGHIRPAYSNDGALIATGTDDGIVKIWDAETGSEVLTLKGHTRMISAASFSRNGKRIVTGSWDGTAKVWDAKTGAEVLTLKGHTGPVTSVSFSANGLQILTGSRDKTAKVWTATTEIREVQPRERE